ncbi:MAG: winged helix-turn-helix transcriptional regulator [Lachnospiraceae bacterium]|nr:winged helix-turn-helix transcriptional regulator [Lachnospiraceae bacterium]
MIIPRLSYEYTGTESTSKKKRQALSFTCRSENIICHDRKYILLLSLSYLLPDAVRRCRQGTGSIPSSIRNELIAKTLYLNKSIEKFGSGFKRIHSLCTDAGIAFSYEKYDIGFKVVLHRNKGTNNVTLNVLENVTLSPTEKTVYLLVSQNPRATKAEIADKISKTDRTVQRALDSLKEKGFIERAGAKKTGYWIIK